MLHVTAGTLEFFQFTRDGFGIGQKGLTGWDSGTESKGETSSYEGTDGDEDLPVFRQSRLVTLTGICVAPSNEELVQRSVQLTALGATGGLIRLTVRQNSLVRWINARVVAGTQWDERTGHKAADFQISFKSASPRKFGTARTFASGEEAVHYGNFPATPGIQVTGSMPNGYTVNGPDGKKITVSRALLPGEVHTIDLDTGLLAVNGVVVFSGVPNPDTWTIAPARPVAHTLTGTGTATLKLTLADTYA